MQKGYFSILDIVLSFPPYISVKNVCIDPLDPSKKTLCSEKWEKIMSDPEQPGTIPKSGKNSMEVSQFFSKGLCPPFLGPESLFLFYRS